MVEVELKYQFDEPAVFQRWATTDRLEDGFRIEPVQRGTVCVRDTYLDTPDYRLLRNGLSLRHRRKEEQSLLTLKSALLTDATHEPHNAARRLEIERPLAEDTAYDAPGCYPQEIRRRIAPLVDERLRPIAVIVQTREKRLIRHQPSIPDPAGSHAAVSEPGREPFAAELSIDEVKIVAPAPAGSDERQETPIGAFFELEVELLSGDEACLTAIAELLAADPDLRHHQRSKLEQALDLIASHQPGSAGAGNGLRPDLPMSEAGRAVLRGQLNRMLQLEPGVRLSDDSEYVHQMRVAIRRSRAAIRLFAAYLSRKRLKKYNRLLRKTGRTLGRVRDLDVALEKGRGTGTIDPALERQWCEERDQAHAELIAWLNSKRYVRFLVDYAQFCQTPEAGARVPVHRPGESPPRLAVAHVAPSLILERFEQVRAYESLFQNGEPVPYATVHALRIDCKNLRYTLEFFEELMGDDATRLVNHLKNLQDLLGDLNDAVVATELLEGEITADQKPSKSVKKHLAHQQELTRKLYGRVPRQLEIFTRPKSRRRLGRAIARI